MLQKSAWSKTQHQNKNAKLVKSETQKKPLSILNTYNSYRVHEIGPLDGEKFLEQLSFSLEQNSEGVVEDEKSDNKELTCLKEGKSDVDRISRGWQNDSISVQLTCHWVALKCRT